MDLVVVIVVVLVDLVVDLRDSGCELEESLRADPTERRSESELFRRPGDPLYMCSWKNGCLAQFKTQILTQITKTHIT